MAHARSPVAVACVLVIAAAGVAPAQQPRRATVVQVVATEYAFHAPDSIAAGVITFEVEERGREGHMMQIVRLPAGRTHADLFAALQRMDTMPSWVTPIAGTAANYRIRKSDVTVRLAPGRYALVCRITLGDRIPHVRKGMYRALTVTAAAEAPRPEPKAAIAARVSDGDIALSGTLRRGSQTVRVDNRGNDVHVLLLARLNDGTSSDDALRWLANRQGPAPFRPEGGLREVPPRGRAYFTAHLIPGRYMLFCTRRGRSGKAHAHEGEARFVDIP